MTLLELMISLVILGALLVVTVPNLAGAGRMGHLNGAARDIVALMRYARSTAIFGEIEVELIFSPDAGLYTIDYDATVMEMQRDERRGRRRSRGRDRRFEEMVERRHHRWRRVRSLPTGRDNALEVFFAAVETEVEVESRRDAGTFLPAVVFYPDGTASSLTLVLEGRTGAQLSLNIFTATGLAEVTVGANRERDGGATENLS